MSNDPKAPPGPDARPAGEIVIEIGDDRNRSLLFGPTKQLLRGRWSRNHLVGVQMTPLMSQLPDIPGMHVSLDCRRRLGRVWDPLSQPGQAELLRKIQHIVKEQFHRTEGPEQELVRENLGDSEIKSWLYWLRRLVDSDQARLVSGQLPSLAEIGKQPGKTKVDHWDSSAHAVRHLEDMPTDPVGV